MVRSKKSPNKSRASQSKSTPGKRNSLTAIGNTLYVECYCRNGTAGGSRKLFGELISRCKSVCHPCKEGDDND
ncbi:hypothetical protein EB796_010558 [Bugula neritina]|uniref:Uncharacterized protein n=1 Tax=Bugula neritina TaxID=10212 RepID=A0A7J7JYY3_BUGNE|nr:hypothetical protein EB796_010558 [Bugula neritina]